MSISSQALSPSASATILGEPSTNGNSSAPLTSFDPAVFKSYLLALLPPVLDASLEDLQDTLFDDEFDDRAVKFASDGGGVVYIAKTRLDSEGMQNALVLCGRRACSLVACRRRATVLLIPPFPSPRLYIIYRNYSRPHQAYPCARHPRAVTVTTTHSQSLWRRRDTVRKLTCCGQLRGQTMV